MRSHRLRRFPLIKENGIAAQLATLASLPVTMQPEHATLRQIPPNFALPDHEGHVHQLHHYIALGKPIVVFFFPLAGSPFCVKEVCAFRDMQLSGLLTFSSASATILGISQDRMDRIGQFVKRHNVPYPILSDEDGNIHDQWGIKTTLLGLLNKRATFVIDSRGVVRGCAEGTFNYKGHIKFASDWLARIAAEDAFRLQGGPAADLVERQYIDVKDAPISSSMNPRQSMSSDVRQTWPAAVHAASLVAVRCPTRPPTTVVRALAVDADEHGTTAFRNQSSHERRIGMMPEPPVYHNFDMSSQPLQADSPRLRALDLYRSSLSTVPSSESHAYHSEPLRDAENVQDSAMPTPFMTAHEGHQQGGNTILERQHVKLPENRHSMHYSFGESPSPSSPFRKHTYTMQSPYGSTHQPRHSHPPGEANEVLKLDESIFQSTSQMFDLFSVPPASWHSEDSATEAFQDLDASRDAASSLRQRANSDPEQLPIFSRYSERAT